MPSTSSWPALGVEAWQEAGFGLYVHWPFCQSKCPYCDFNSHIAGEVDHAVWVDAFVSEIRRLGAELGPRPLSSIFFGGGTPSLMPEASVASVIEAAVEVFAPSNTMEITLEANPSSVEAGRFRGYRSAGVNRVSIGVQALCDEALRALGRLHSVAEARNALDIAMRTFDRVSFDLIYARQNQSAADWESELSEALAIGTDHLSLYQLTIEPGTAFGDRFARGRLQGLPDEDLGADMYGVTQSLTGGADLPAYEISNHSAPGSECIHNLIYWRSGDYAGVGPGAHGRVTLGGQRYATEATRRPDRWLAAVTSGGTGETTRRSLPDDEVFEERLMMGLRLVEGLDLGTLPALDPERLSGLQRDGWVSLEGGRIRVTDAGRPILNAILRELLA